VSGEDHGRVDRNGLPEVLQHGDIGGAHLHEPGPCLLHDVRYAESSADLDELALETITSHPRPNSLRIRKTLEAFVVDYKGVLRAGKIADELLGESAASATILRGDMKFQIAVAGKRGGHAAKYIAAERRTAKIGMDYYARAVDDALKPVLLPATTMPYRLGDHIGRGAFPPREII
jgi:hypothetical protein